MKSLFLNTEYGSPLADHASFLSLSIGFLNGIEFWLLLSKENNSNFRYLLFLQICNAVAIAKIMRATLILPVLKQDQIWKDQS
jgi:hypothetical protein